MLALLADPQNWLAFVTLSLLEIVLGFDNIIFISILVGRLPAERQESARITGLALAMLTRIALLFSIVWLTGLVQPLFYVGDMGFSGRDLILGGGGLFLLAKSVLEIHHTLEGAGRQTARARQAYASFAMIVVQIGAIDVVFSLDSVFTAVGLAKELTIMVAAIIASMLVMMWISRRVGAFIERYPTIKMLALAFLILIGVALVGEALEFEIPKGYLYFAMAFAVIVELVNIRLRRKLDAHKPLDEDEGG
ncbi:MAG: Integral rane protein TerC [Gammaproteobacteria bacterium]|nr:Integral rane protein TerC [Gammaproteobacteria bacterium]